MGTSNRDMGQNRQRRRWLTGGTNRVRASIALALGCAMASPLIAQTHKVAKTQDAVRAVGVYEWTGDLAKPTASRLIPVSLFINGRLQEAAVYLAQPVPLSLLSGNVYELQKSGVAQGTLDLAFARKLVPTANAYTSYDEGWFGYGKFQPPAPVKKSTLKPATTVAKINAIDDENDDKPHFSARSATPGTGGSAASTPGSAPAASSTPADDPDRPVLHRGSSGDASASDVPDDPDRPTLKKHASAPTDGKAQGNVVAAGSPMDDPSRPTLHRGKPVSSMNDDDLPKLAGLPADADLQQMAAVSDPADRMPHDFTRAWDNDAERQEVLGKMQDAAHAALTVYEKDNDVAPTNAVVPPPAAPAPPRRTATGAAARRSAVKKTPPPPPPPPEPLMDEKLEGYALSYGGAATYVYSAHTDGLGSAQRFVTVVAQDNMQGEPVVALKSVTDATHLDRAPRMRLVDVVDADASNRASLLFELRAQSSRQFALYSVIGGRASQTFLTGSTR